MKREHVTNTLLVLAAAGVGILCFRMAAPFLMAISWAAVLAIVIYPIHLRIERIVRWPTLAAALSCIVALLLGILPLVVVGTALTRAVIGYLDSHTIEGPATIDNMVEWLNTEAGVVLDWLETNFEIGRIDPNTIRDTVKQAGTFLAGQTQQFLGGIAGFFFNVVIVIFTLFFFLRDRTKVLAAIESLLPLSSENTKAVYQRVFDVINASVLGGGAVSVVQGILTAIAFWILGLPSPLLWGMVTAFCSFIPFVGAAAIWVPTTLILLVQGHLGSALFLALYGGLGISLVDNFIRPIFIGDRTQLPTIVIFFSILGGLQVFGFLGIIMGPVVLTVGLALLEIFRREIMERQEEERRVTGRLLALAGGADSQERPGATP